jgi:excisionase family DNA binding protein
MSSVSTPGHPAVLLTEAEVAQVLRVSSRTIRRWAACGTVPAVQIGGVRRFRLRDVAALIDPSTDLEPAGNGREVSRP